MSDEEPREFRRDVGNGWTLVTSTAHRDALVYLEGPHGIRATVPQERAEAAFTFLRIPIAFRHKRGRPPKLTRNRLMAAILEEHVAGAQSPTEEAVAARLDVDPRHVQRAKPEDVTWPEFVRGVVAGWDYIAAHPELVRVRRTT